MSRSLSITNVSQLVVATGIKTSIATAASIQTYDGVAINGTLASAGVATPAVNGHTGIAAYPTATLSSQTGAYVASSTIQFRGKWGSDLAKIRTATITSANGNQTVTADGPLENVNQIIVAAQALTNGAFTFGFSGLARAKSRPRKVWVVRGAGTGNLVFVYGGGETDTVAVIDGTICPCSPVAILASSTAVFTAYME